MKHKDVGGTIVVSALDTVTNNLGRHLKTIGVTAKVELLQKAALLGTAKILRKDIACPRQKLIPSIDLAVNISLQ